MEQRFEWKRPTFGKPKGFVTIGAEVRFEHQLLKSPLTLPSSVVRAVARIVEVHSDDPLLNREPRRVDLHARVADSNVVILFEPAAHIDRFSYGAENALSISRKERKRGVDVDLLGLAMDDPDGVVDALTLRDVARYPTLDQMLIAEIGRPVGTHIATKKAERTRRRMQAVRKLYVIGVAYSLLLSARLGLGGANPSTASFVALSATSLVWSSVLGVAISIRGGPRRSRPVRDPMSKGKLVALIAALLASAAIPPLLALWFEDHLGTPEFLVYGLVAGVPGGAFIGMAMIASRRNRDALTR